MYPYGYFEVKGCDENKYYLEYQKRNKEFSSLKVSMPISHRLCTEVQTQRDIRTNKKRYRGDTSKAVRAERRGNHRSRGVRRSYPHVGKHSATH